MKKLHCIIFFATIFMFTFFILNKVCFQTGIPFLQQLAFIILLIEAIVFVISYFILVLTGKVH